MGLRSPLQFHWATKMSNLSGNLEKIEAFFNVGDEEDENDLDTEETVKFKI